MLLSALLLVRLFKETGREDGKVGGEKLAFRVSRFVELGRNGRERKQKVVPVFNVIGVAGRARACLLMDF